MSEVIRGSSIGLELHKQRIATRLRHEREKRLAAGEYDFLAAPGLGETMPHDRNGNEVKLDDLVAIPFRVISVTEGPVCSCTLESTETIQGDYKVSITVNAKDIRVRPNLEDHA